MPAHRFGHMPTADPDTHRRICLQSVKKYALRNGLFDKSAIKSQT